MTPASRLATLLLLPALALGACGGGDDDGGGSGSLPDDPAAAVKASGDALAKVAGFHLEGTGTDEDGEGKVAADVRADGSFSAQLTQGGQAFELRFVDGSAYFKAGAGFWQENGGAQAVQALADKWVKGPAEQFGAGEIVEFIPKNLAACLSSQAGTLSDGGTGEVDGTDVRVIKSVGDQPRQFTGELSLAAEGEPYPLRIRKTAPDKAGGTPDPRCGEDEEADSSSSSDTVLSDFGADAKIEVPAGAVDLASLSAGGGDGAS